MKPSFLQPAESGRSKKISFFKNLFFSLITLLSTMLLIEMASIVLILTGAINVGPSNLKSQFPAQLTMTQKELKQEFSFLRQPAQQKIVGNFYARYIYDPVMGYRINLPKPAPRVKPKDIVILTFGGSTTIGKRNWPGYLEKAAQDAGVKETLEILNYGVGGHTSFTEKLWFSQWVLPDLEDQDIQPDIILTLDGNNDVAFGLFGYAESLIHQSEHWYWNYHAHHQQLDFHIHQLQHFTGAMASLIELIKKNSLYQAGLKKLARIMPYTLKLISLPHPQPYKNLPLTWNAELQKDMLSIPEDVQGLIVRSFKNSLIDFHSLAQSRNIKFISYLQPVMLNPYYQYPSYPKDVAYPSFDYLAISHRRSGSLLGGDYIVEMEALYKKAEEMYAELNERLPGSFKNLTRIFLNTTSNQYKSDAIHYTREASETIAKNIINDLIEKKILTVKQIKA